MDFIFSPVRDTPSVFVKTSQSIISCMVHFNQKTESEESLLVTFKDLPIPGQEEMVKSVIQKVLINPCPVTQIHVEYMEMVKGRDCISCYINGFSIAAILGDLTVSDTLCSAYFLDNACIGNMTYLHNKEEVIDFHLTGKVANPDEYHTMGIEECKKNYKNFISRLEEFRITGENRE